MTDALCGPSNALQNFQKHASSDRSLQQDRLAVRGNQHGQQGFRSQANGNAGALDPEFEAFQAGASIPQTNDALSSQSPVQRLPPPQIFSPSRFQPQQQQSSPSGWASDFARMHISSPQPAPAPAPLAFHHEPSQQPRLMNAWLVHSNAMDPSEVPGELLAPLAHYRTQQGRLFNGSGGFQQPLGYVPTQTSFTAEQQSSESRWKGKGRWNQEAAIEKDAFDREFEAMAAETLRDETSEGKYMGLDETNQTQSMPISEQEYAQSMENHEADISTDADQPTMEDVLAEEAGINMPFEQGMQAEKIDERNVPETDEDLARTAGVLLDQVSTDTSEKFAQSNFLALMRQFRDREKRIHGNKVVDSDADPANMAPDENLASQDADATRNGPAGYGMTGALDPPSYKTGKSRCEYPSP